jgi:regulator of RNase E activity RraA
VRPGCVITVANEAPGFAYFGDLNATLAIARGLGAVIDGVTRDSRDVSLLGLPVYARRSYCDDIKYEGTLGSMNMPVKIGDVRIEHDDMIFGDENGVVVIPHALWPKVEEAAWDVLTNEARIRIMAAGKAHRTDTFGMRDVLILLRIAPYNVSITYKGDSGFRSPVW